MSLRTQLTETQTFVSLSHRFTIAQNDENDSDEGRYAYAAFHRDNITK